MQVAYFSEFLPDVRDRWAASTCESGQGFVWRYMYMYVCMCIYVCMYACMHVCIYVCMYVYTHTHTHTHTESYYKPREGKARVTDLVKENKALKAQILKSALYRNFRQTCKLSL